jgi:hypothetical protein
MFLMADARVNTDPYPHYVIDNFFEESVARTIEDYNSDRWFVYDNPLEKKKAINSWYEFKPETYRTFHSLMSDRFIKHLQLLTGNKELSADYGLHGGGWHIQGNGGLLNVHLDYSIHPKLNMKRKYNLIVYLSDWDPSWGGNLELWSHDQENNQPKENRATIECKFNRAVLFDASLNSWHGFSDEIKCPPDKYRRSLAAYYMCPASETDPQRNRALYSLREEQKQDLELKKLSEFRSM